MRKVGSRSWILCLVALTAATLTAGWAGRAFAQEKLGSEFQVNTYTTADQEEPAVAADASGNFVVVWQSFLQDGDEHGVFGQRFDSAGAKLGGEFQVNTYTTGYQQDPAVAAGASGGFVVVWEGCLTDDSSCDIFGQRLDSAGAKLDSEFQVNTYTTHDQEDPAVAADASGSFVVVWESYLQDGDYFGVFGQRFDSAGAKAGGEFQVNTYTTDKQYLPSVASDGSGGFVVVWESYDQDGDETGVVGQSFDSAGAKVGGEFQANTYTTSYQENAAVAADASSGFVVVWESAYQDGNYYGVFGQRFDGAGTKVGGEFQVNTYTTGEQFLPSVASDGSGGFVVVWESYGQDGEETGVFGQRLDSAGTKVGGEFQINTYTTNYQEDPVVAADPSGNFVVVWQSYYQDGDGPSVFAQRFSALRSDCRAAEEQKVSLEAKGGKLEWSWKKGVATAQTDFGNPTADTAYRMCLYDAVSGTPAGLCIDVPPGADWKDQKNGFTFKSKTGVEGITSIQLEAGEAGKAKLAVKGKDVALPALPLTQHPEVVLELSNSVGQCWQSRFATARKNDESKFTAKE